MDFLFRTKKTKKTEFVAIFDIGSGSVGGAIVEIYKKGYKKNPTILQSVRTDIINKNSDDKSLLFENTLNALSLSSNRLYKENKFSAPTKIFCILSSPWYISKFITINLENQKIEDALSEEFSNILDKYNGYSLFEHFIEKISRDEKIVKYNKNTVFSNLKIDSMMSLSDSIHLKKFRDILFNVFHDRSVNFYSFASMSYFATLHKYIDKESYILMDVSGEMTDISIVVNGILSHSVSFPYGKNTLFRDIQKSLNMDFRSIKESFNLFISNNLSQREKDKLIPVLKNLEIRWQKYFIDAISKIKQTDELIIPNTLFLTTDEDIKQWFVDAISSSSSNILNIKSNVVFLDGKEFLNLCSVLGGVCDPFLMIESIGVNKINE